MQYNQWIDEIFNREQVDGFEANLIEWLDEPQVSMRPEETLLLISQTFERAGKDLVPFSDIQISYGIDYITNESSEPLYAIYNVDISLMLRRRAIESFVPLYRDLFALRCDNCLADNSTNCLNALCYMLWDAGSLYLDGFKQKNDPNAEALCEAFMNMLENILFLPHKACQESALHGLGHSILSCYDKERFPKSYEKRMVDMIKRFMNQKGIDSKILAYAKQAKTGQVL